MMSKSKKNRFKDFHVLVVDDDKLIQKLLREVLQKLGFVNIHMTANGNNAVTITEEQHIDFVICDWRLPGLSGLDFTRHLRSELSAVNPLMPIIMLTGNAEAEQVVEARDAGVNEYLIKPFTVKELCRRITEIIERPREFVLAAQYKGPSRRRRAVQSEVVSERRTKSVQAVKRK